VDGGHFLFGVFTQKVLNELRKIPRGEVRTLGGLQEKWANLVLPVP
jgi:O6-methylguanine-DNA--protein-cysteine methyltransferase